MFWIALFLASAALAETSSRDPMQSALEKQRASATRQRDAIRKQAEALGVWLLPMGAEPEPPPPPPAAATEPSCETLADAAIIPLVEEAAKAQEVEAQVLRAVIERESAFRPCVVSSKGAKGLMQLMPETARELGVTDVFDPRQSVEGGARYLKQLLTRYQGDLAKALAAYNAGPEAVDQAKGIPDFRETREYVQAILRKVRAPPQ
jgi:soluble lytic murein transglycosylase-like protein